MGIEEEIKRHTLAEYLAMEEQAESRSEFYNGQIFAMSGGSPEHSTIAANFISSMNDAFRNKGCRVFDASLMIRIERLNSVLYPDASMVCGPLERDLQSSNLVRNPALVVEVLSKSTQKYDRGNKFFKYQMIPSLQTYVLAEQSEPIVHVSHKNANGAWEFDNYFGLDAAVDLKPFGVSITMAQIYQWIDFR
ncbi:MAG TPA: Uma2 family endonuclease [Bacteroidia bacterium]|jgi:Uma2 family endonuclease|nr:Uma2 family endonuclease [Bacteroidia bacterium]